MAALKSGDRNLRHVTYFLIHDSGGQSETDMEKDDACKTVCRSLFNQENALDS